jgi:hypothetical protein
MAASIFCASGGKAKSPVVWPPSYSASQWAFGWRGNVIDPRTGLYVRLQYLLGQYPKPAVAAVPEQTALLAARLQAVQPDAERLVELRAVLGEALDRFELPEPVMAADRAFRSRKLELDRALLRGEVTREAYADQVNAEAAVLMRAVRTGMQPEVATMFSAEPAAALIDIDAMPSAEAYQRVGERLLG